MVDCNNVSIIVDLHNKLRDGVSDLAGKSFTPLYVNNNPLVHSVCSLREGKARPKGSLLNNPSVTNKMSEQK